MKARKKGTQEWKEYKEVFGPDHEFLGLETLGYWQSDEDYCKEHCIPYDPENPFNTGGYYKSAVLPLECFDLWEETDWSVFRKEAAKDILAGMVGNMFYEDHNSAENYVKIALMHADELIKQLKMDETIYNVKINGKDFTP